MNTEKIMRLADAYANAVRSWTPTNKLENEARAALEAALTEKQDNTAPLNVQYHEASMRKFFGTEKQEPVAMRFPHTADWDKVTCPTCNATFNVETAPVAEQEPVVWAKFTPKGNIFDLLEEEDDGAVPLYTHPAPVNQQLLEALKEAVDGMGGSYLIWEPKARAAIQAAEKEKT